MKQIALLFITKTLIAVILISGLPPVFACGPFIIEPLFQFTKHGEYPLSRFAGGDGGLVPNTYGRISLFVFYRHLNDLPFTETERQQVERAIEHRVGTRWREEDDPAGPVSGDELAARDYQLRWVKARARLMTGEKQVGTDKQFPDSYYYYSNCLGGAFKTAAETLDDRISKYGINEYTKDWAAGQDAVFSNCEEDGQTPAAVAETGPKWLKHDRAYQTAAALFYASRLAESRQIFESIARDRDSVWKNTARYVVARTLIREASFIETGEGDDEMKALARTRQKELLAAAEKHLREIISDPSMREFHNSSRQLINLIKYRAEPTARRNELGQRLAKKEQNSNIFNDLTDYVWLLDQPERGANKIGPDRDRSEAEAAGEDEQLDFGYRLKLRDLDQSDRDDDLTDWLYSYQSADGFEHAHKKWKEAGQLHWLVAAVSKAKTDTGGLSELFAEADKIDRKSPAYATIRFHRIRLLLETGDREQAGARIDEVLSNNFAGFPISTQNAFKAQKMAAAGSLDEFIKYSHRRAATFTDSSDSTEIGGALTENDGLTAWQNRMMFDADAVAFLNEKAPLSVLREVALHQDLPLYLREFVISAVWTRSFLLGNRKIEKEFAPLMLRHNKEFSQRFTTYVKTRSAADQEASALLVILSYPIIQPYVPFGVGRGTSVRSIDSIRGNWWCAPVSPNEAFQKYDHTEFEYPAVYPGFLTPAQTSEALEEFDRLNSLGNSSTLLARRTVEFARSNPQHRLTPQLLHLAVRATRYGCTDDDTETYSKAAFVMLHTKYPRSVWTKRTPYWFK